MERCPVPRCETYYSDGSLMCRNHWGLLPPEIRTRLLAGDEDLLERAIAYAYDRDRGYQGRNFDPELVR